MLEDVLGLGEGSVRDDLDPERAWRLMKK